MNDVMKERVVKVLGTCPHCNEAVEMVMTKKQVKMILKGFQMPIMRAQLMTEHEMQKAEKSGT